MNYETADKENIKNYLLKNLSAPNRQEVEARLFSDEDFYDFFIVEEGELIEKYLDRELSSADRLAFETNFATHPNNQANIRLTQALRRIANESKVTEKSDDIPEKSVWDFDFRKLFPILVPGFALLIIAFGLLYWWNSVKDADLNRGLAGLKDAYKTARPLQSRVSDFEYSPFTVTRGDDKKDTENLDRAKSFLLQAVKDNPNSASYSALGKYYLAAKDYDKAIENFTNAINSDKNNAKLNNDLGAAWLEKGKNDLLTDKGRAAIDFGQSQTYFDKALSLDKNLLEALFNRAETYQKLGMPEKAAEDLQNYLQKDASSRWADEVRERLKILEELKSKTSITDHEIIRQFKIAYNNQDGNQAWQIIKLARSRTGNIIVQQIVADFLSEPPDSHNNKTNFAMLRFAADVEKQSVGDSFLSDLADYYKNADQSQLQLSVKGYEAMKIGKSAYLNSQFSDALVPFSNAKNYFAAAKNMPETMQSENWLGYCNLRLLNHKEGLTIFNELAKEYKNQSYLSLYSQSLIGIADAQSGANEPSKSLEFIENALSVAEKAQDIESQMRCYQLIAVLKYDNGMYRESLDSTTREIELAAIFPAQPVVLWGLYNITADNFAKLKLFGAAVAYQHKTTQLAERPQSKYLSYNQLAQFQSDNGEFEAALKSANLALLKDMPKEESFRVKIDANVSSTLGNIYLKNREFSKALEYYTKAEDIFSNIIKYEEPLYQIYGKEVLCYIGLNNNESAQDKLQKGLEKLEVFRNNINNEEDRNHFFDIQQNYYDVAIGFANSQLNDSTLALNYAEKSRARNLLNLMQPKAAPLEIQELQSRLSDSIQILEFAILEDKVVSWVVTKDSIKSVETPISSDELNKKIRNYLDLMTKGGDSTKENLDKLARELYQLLISPNESSLDEKRTLFIVPDKDLNFLPFSSLKNPQTNKYLVEKYEIGISPSLNVFVLSSEIAKEKSAFSAESILSVGNPKFDRKEYKNLEDLPSSEREAKRIGYFYKSLEILTREQATEEKVRADLQDFEVVHFASHAVTDALNPSHSGLVLSKSANFDGTFRAEEIFAQPKFLRTKLIVLSGCETGIENALRGEGAISLARPFLAQNVPLVIASLWKIDSDSTAELMINFHRNRQEKQLSSLQALRQAQIEMIQSSNESFRQPKAWSSLIAIGGETAY